MAVLWVSCTPLVKQHPGTLLTELQTTGARGLGGKELGVWRSGNRYALPTSPHPRLRLSIDKNSRATLTKKLVQKIGQTTVCRQHTRNLERTATWLAECVSLLSPTETLLRLWPSFGSKCG